MSNTKTSTTIKATRRNTTKSTTGRKPTKVSVEARKEKREEVLELAKQKLEYGVMTIFNSGKYDEYLRTISKFHNYSFNNTVLITTQKPDATLVNGLHKWGELGRKVKKGEHGIMIFAPSTHKTKIKVLNKDGKPILDDDGNEMFEEKSFTRYFATYVFDISQTEGKELPTLVPDELKGKVKNYKTLIKKLLKIAPCKVEFGDTGNKDVKGYYDPVENKIVVRSDLEQIMTVKTLIHEIGHSIMHNPEALKDKKYDRKTKEVQAESVSYLVSDNLGLDTSEYSFGYIAGWSGKKTVDELKDSLELITTTSNTILDKIKL